MAVQDTISQAALGTLVPAIARRASWAWLGYGVAAYVALRVARHYGVGGKFPDRALGYIDDAFDSVTGKFGVSSRSAQL